MSVKRLGLLAIAAGVFASGWLYSPKEKHEWKRAPDNVARFPLKLPHRYFVSDKDERSNVFFYQDNVTPRQALTDAPDGLQYETQYNPRGIRTSWQIFYSRPDGGRGQLRQDSTFTADGSAFMRDTIYYRTGKVFQVGTLLTPDRYSKSFYREDGRIRRNELHTKRDSQWTLEQAEEFDYSDSTSAARLIESIKRMDDGTMQLQRYKPNGKVLVMVTNNVGNATKIETWYFEDGKTPRFEVFRGDYKVTVTTFNRSGRKLEERDFSKSLISGDSGTDQDMEVTFFDRYQRKTHTQRWVKHEGNFKLAAVQTYFANGQEKRIVIFGLDAKGKIFIEGEQIYLSSREDSRPFKIYALDSSGRVLKYEHSRGDYINDYTRDYEPGKGPRRSVVVEPEFTRMVPYNLPPKQVQEMAITLSPEG